MEMEESCRRIVGECHLMDVHIAKGCQQDASADNCGEVVLLQLWADLGERARYQSWTMSAVHKLYLH